MNAKGLNYIAIDFETANKYKNSACQIGLARFKNGKCIDTFCSLIRPPKLYFEPSFIDIHKISYDEVKGKPDFVQIWKERVLPFIKKEEVPLVAHNAEFDMNVVRECCDYFGLRIPEFKYFDSLALARTVWPELGCHKLTFMGEHFNIKYKAHDACEDAIVCGRLVEKAAKEMETKSLNTLLKATGIELCNLRK